MVILFFVLSMFHGLQYAQHGARADIVLFIASIACIIWADRED
jgi:hypothetical protein